MTPTPVHIEVTTPARFERLQLLIRLLLGIVLGWLGFTVGWLVGLLFVALPLVAAISSTLGEARFRTAVAPRVSAVLAWLLQLSAYMMLLTDRFPAGTDTTRVELPITAHPTPSSALMRLVTSLPSGVVLLVLWFVSGILWFVAAAAIVVGVSIPQPIHGYQRGVLRWQARLVAYHASLVDDYPPFTLDTDELDHGSAFAASAASS